MLFQVVDCLSIWGDKLPHADDDMPGCDTSTARGKGSGRGRRRGWLEDYNFQIVAVLRTFVVALLSLWLPTVSDRLEKPKADVDSDSDVEEFAYATFMCTQSKLHFNSRGVARYPQPVTRNPYPTILKPLTESRYCRSWASLGLHLHVACRCCCDLCQQRVAAWADAGGVVWCRRMDKKDSSEKTAVTRIVWQWGSVAAKKPTASRRRQQDAPCHGGWLWLPRA